MISAIQAFSSTAYSSALLQARYGAVANQQSVRAGDALRAARSGVSGLNSAAEQAGAAAVQQLFGRAAFEVQTTQPTPDDNRIGQQPRRLRDQAGLNETPEAIDRSAESGFSPFLDGRGQQAPTLADIQSGPSLALDSSSFLALFAQFAGATSPAATARIAAQPFQRASSALEQIYAGFDEPAIDFAA